MHLPSLSPLQFEHLDDGRIQLAGHPDVNLLVPEAQAVAVRPEWEATLGFPYYFEEWQEWAVANGLSGRRLRFVLCDSSPTTHVGHWRFQPERIRLGEQRGRWLLTAGHSGFCIGLAYGVMLATKDTMPGLGLDGTEWPGWVEGNSCLIGQAMLYESRLADAAWAGVQRGILNRVCAVVSMQPGEEPGTGTLVEVAL
ncbi:MAG: hypothetical protein ABIU05_07390, partial [Nitrospirales bacterium]